MGQTMIPPDAVTLKLELSGTQFFSGWLAWDDASVSLDAQVITKYNYAGGQRVAVRKGNELSYLLGDHLALTGCCSRYNSGALPTKYTYTGQYSNMSDFGLMYYNARWYDPALGRFTSADTLIPEPGNPQSWDRYAYVRNNPLRYTDPSGHMQSCGIGESGRECGYLAYITIERRLLSFGIRLSQRASRTFSQSQKEDIYAVAQAYGMRFSEFTRMSAAKSFQILTPRGVLIDVCPDLSCDAWALVNENTIFFKEFYPDSTINQHFIAHEVTHVIDKWSGDLDDTQEKNRYFPDRCDERGPNWGFAGDMDVWQFSRDKGASEEFADMGVGWVFDEWAANADGDARRDWMNELFVNLATGETYADYQILKR